MSFYLSHPDVPPARIGAYPKRRPQHSEAFLPVPPPERHSTGAADVCYQDFFSPDSVLEQTA